MAMDKPAAFGAGKAPGALAGLGARFDIRFAAIWLALAALFVVSAVVAPRSLLLSSLLSIAPFAAFLAIAALGESVVLMSRGIDLSIPAIVTLSSTMLLGFSRGSDDGMFGAIVGALAFATAVGFINGVFVGIFKLNALIVTLAIGAVTAGATLWYRDSLAAESRVPPLLATWGGTRIVGLNVAVWVAIVLVVALTVALKKTTIGRRFAAVGANPRAAWVAGINVPAYQITAFTVAGFLYGVAGIMVSAFVRNPTLNVGDPYLLAPIAAAVLGGTAITGGIGSMVAVAGAALFLTHLGQMLKVLGVSTAFQFVINGLAIALGMALAESKWLRAKFTGKGGWAGRVLNLGARELWVGFYIVAVVALVAWSRTASASWDDWLERYQALIAGIIAFGGAVLAFFAAAGRIEQAQAHERHRREREDYAARALLPAALGTLCDYASACTRLLLGLLPAIATNQRVAGRLEAIPAIPEGVLPAFQAAIEAAERKNAGQLADLLAALHVQHARLGGLVDRDPDHGVTRGEVCRHVIAAAELYAGAVAVFDYARRARNDVALDLSAENIAAALRDSRVFGYREIDPMIAQWTMAQSIYRASLPST